MTKSRSKDTINIGISNDHEVEANNLSATESIQYNFPVYVTTYILGGTSIVLNSSLAEKLVYHSITTSITNLGEILYISTDGLSEALAGAIVFLDACSTLTLFDPKTVATRWSEKLSCGFIAGIKDHLSLMYEYPLKIGLITLAMCTAYPIGGYFCVEPMKESMELTLGMWHWIPLTLLLTTVSSYYVFSQAEENFKGISYLLGEQNCQLLPPQERLLYRLWQEPTLSNFSTVFQISLESFSAIMARSITYAYLAGRMMAQAGLSDGAIMSGQLIGLSTCLLALGPSRIPVTFTKYLGNETNRYDLVTADERNQIYQQHYHAISWTVFMLKEIIRLLRSPLGIAESILLGYFGSYLGLLIPQIELVSGLMSQNILPPLFGVIIGGLAYFLLYRQADLTLELNRLALHDANIHHRLSTATNQANQGLNNNAQNQQAPLENQSFISHWLSVIFAFGKSAAITLSSFSFTMSVLSVTSISKTDQAVFSIASNVIVSNNNYHFVQNKNEQTLETIKDRTASFISPAISKISSCFFSFKNSIYSVQSNDAKNEETRLHV